MRTGRPKRHPIVLDDAKRAELERIASSRSQTHGLVRRAQIVLWSAEGVNDPEIGRRLGLTYQTVAHWRERYVACGVAGRGDAPKSGRPRTYDDERVAELINTAVHSQPKGRTHWPVRALSAETGV